ncbi:MAG: hypothetical protein U9R60_17865 [Bacteroidota bacterium]|nr:hypothetical protein [Bacteroidota bacterium]
MAVGDEVRKNYASDTGTYNAGVEARQIGGNAAKVLASVVTNKKADAKAAAHRSAISAVDTGDISSATGSKDVGNSPHVECHCAFDDASANCKLALAMFDEANDLIGITEIVYFETQESWRDGAAGLYVAGRYIFDVGVAAKVRALVSELGTGNVVTIYLEAI